MLKHFFNRLYDENLDVDAIIEAVQSEIDTLNDTLQGYFSNNFPMIATEGGILQWEIILGIVADTSIEPLEFRRGRVLNRLSSNTPFTERALQGIMDNIMGVNSWSYELDYRDYRLDITSLIPGKNWLREMAITLEKIIPANMLWYFHMYYNAHSRLADFTHEHLSGYTHAQLMEDDISA